MIPSRKSHNIVSLVKGHFCPNASTHGRRRLIMEPLKQIKIWERIVESGLDDGIVGRTVDKLISSQIQK
jgi:hypothetical protein